MFVKIGEPPSADPHARWCERPGVSHPLLLDCLIHGMFMGFVAVWLFAPEMAGVSVQRRHGQPR